jgi:hypothetical protein
MSDLTPSPMAPIRPAAPAPQSCPQWFAHRRTPCRGRPPRAASRQAIRRDCNRPPCTLPASRGGLAPTAIHPAHRSDRRPKNSDRPSSRREFRCRAWPKHPGSERKSPLLGHIRGHARLPISLSAGQRRLSSVGIVAANLRSRRLTLRRVFSHFFLTAPGSSSSSFALSLSKIKRTSARGARQRAL